MKWRGVARFKLVGVLVTRMSVAVRDDTMAGRCLVLMNLLEGTLQVMVAKIRASARPS